MITDSVFQFIFLPFLFVHLATLMSFNLLEKIIFIGLFEFWLHTSEIRCFISSEITLLKLKSLEIKITVLMFSYFEPSQTKYWFSYCFYIQLSNKPYTLDKVEDMLVFMLDEVRSWSFSEYYEQKRKSWELVFPQAFLSQVYGLKKLILGQLPLNLHS